MKKYLLLVCLALISFYGQAQLRMPVIFDDHMVLQQQSPAPIWGWAQPAQDIVIHVSWDTTTIYTKTDNAAYWSATLYTPVAGGPHTITVQAGADKRTFQDVLIGEVWVCSGQSNMEWPMSATADGKLALDNVNDPTIRLFHITKSAASFPQVRGEGQWKVCDRESAKYFSSVGYFFGKKLNQQLNVPIGLISAAWSGSPAEAWTPENLVLSNDALKAAAGKLVEKGGWPIKPGVIYNSMIAPIVPYRIAGAIWYQGESNASTAATYKQLMETLIGAWRKDFRHDFPFYYAQIAPWSGYKDDNGVQVREQQVDMLQIPKTGMIVTSDLVDNIEDIHPQYKKPVGERLANTALGDVYHKKDVTYLNPLYKSIRIEKNRIVVSFDNVPNGLIAKGGPLTHFEIAGDDKKFFPAQAAIVKNTVVVSAKEVKNPKAVRFAWSNAAMPNLFSKEGLPVPAFRSEK